MLLYMGIKSVPSTKFSRTTQAIIINTNSHMASVCVLWKKAFRCKWTFILFVTHSVLLSCKLHAFWLVCSFSFQSHPNTILYFSFLDFARCEPLGKRKKYSAKSYAILTTQIVCLFWWMMCFFLGFHSYFWFTYIDMT